MRLTLKLATIIVAAVVALLIVDGYLNVRRQISLFESDMRNDVRLLGHALEGPVAHVWRNDGEAEALAMLDDTNAQQDLVRVRWVWLDARPGDDFAPAARNEALKDAKPGAAVTFRQSDRFGVGHLYRYVPVDVGAGRPGAIELVKDTTYARRYVMTSIVRTVVLTVVLIAVIAIIVGVVGISMVGRPLSELTQKAQRIGTGDLEGDIRIRGRDELSVLGATMNIMCAQLAAAIEKIKSETEARIAAIEQLRHADRLQTVGRLASGIAHELGTPLNVVSGRASLIAAGKISAEETTHSANVIKQQVERITILIRQLLDFARRRARSKATVDLREIVRNTIELLKPQIRKQGCELAIATDESAVTATVDPGQVEQAVTNLVVNALQAMPRGGAIEVDLRRVEARPPGTTPDKEADYARLTVQDQGVGIPDEVKEHLFEPFFTTKDIGEGTGLGLSIVYGIVNEHNGWIDVSSSIDKGTRFDIYLPAGAS